MMSSGQRTPQYSRRIAFMVIVQGTTKLEGHVSKVQTLKCAHM